MSDKEILKTDAISAWKNLPESIRSESHFAAFEIQFHRKRGKLSQESF